MSRVKLVPLQTQPPNTGSGVQVGLGAKVTLNVCRKDHATYDVHLLECTST